jgi:hypothetical protein
MRREDIARITSCILATSSDYAGAVAFLRDDHRMRLGACARFLIRSGLAATGPSRYLLLRALADGYRLGWDDRDTLLEIAQALDADPVNWTLVCLDRADRTGYMAFAPNIAEAERVHGLLGRDPARHRGRTIRVERHGQEAMLAVSFYGPEGWLPKILGADGFVLPKSVRDPVYGDTWVFVLTLRPIAGGAAVGCRVTVAWGNLP